ncbi:MULTISPECIES: hypothetical protein [unclassified Sphingobacterium]|uniref:hypothetical protein n=1 Tax=unclassified Sphingobacterium TaxID=2609468 RepID=UPI00105161BA|nr:MULTISPECIES: hypothetical protein [unclassified Sphingobacterium]MCS3552879.1 hypothetical protein [Sphingobacterium sp. JUb21]TCR10367.1 hypothetical protein EDF66_101181 [Sphingobacterium sp. JUb20]
MKHIIHAVRLSLFSMLGLIFLSSCTKTEQVDFEKEPQNKMIEYKIINSQQQLMGAIDQDQNTINIYIPYYLGVDYLVPQIKMDKGAILIDEKGEEINLDGGVEPVRVGDAVSYRVKGEDNAVRTYTLSLHFLPFNQELTASYTTAMTDTKTERKAATDPFKVYGNFASTSTFAHFTFTDKATGKKYKDFTKVISVAPSEAYYTMSVDIVPEAIAGNYEVELEHQGRTVKLPDMEIYYGMPFPSFFDNPKTYAVGDSITFIPSSFGSTSGQGVYLEIERAYMVILEPAKVPTGFPLSSFGKEIELKVASQNRREVKLLMPDLPNGTYQSTSNQILIYFDYAPNTGYGKGIRTGVFNTSFEITPKK